MKIKPGAIKRSGSPENARSSPFNAAVYKTLKTVVPGAITLPPFFLVFIINTRDYLLIYIKSYIYFVFIMAIFALFGFRLCFLADNYWRILIRICSWNDIVCHISDGSRSR